jgi:hypothetical protein
MIDYQSKPNFSVFKKGIDLRQTQEWGKYLGSLGWKSETVKNSKKIGIIYVRIKSLGILGSIIKVQRPTILNNNILKDIEKLAIKHRAILVKIEPEAGFEKYSLLQTLGYKTDSWPTMPTKTTVLDLSKDIPLSYAKSARYDLRKAEKENLEVLFFKTSDPIAQKEFYNLFKNSAKGKFFVTSFQKDFVPKCHALEPISFIALACKKEQKDLRKEIGFHPTRVKPGLGSEKGTLLFSKSLCSTYLIQPPFLSGAFVSVVGNTAHYVHAGTTVEGKQKGAPYKLIFEISKKLKKDKVKYFDLDGVYDSRYPGFTKSWQGFTKFKSNFGGFEVLYPHSFTKYRLFPLKILAKLSGI